jgi:CRP/FNR family transcriptional regulator
MFLAAPVLLDGLPADLRKALLAKTRLRHLESGEILAAEGDPSPGLAVILSGSVKVYKTSAEGREQVLLVAGPGESVGDVAALTDQPMPASAEAVEASTVLLLPTSILERAIVQDGRFALAVIRHLCQRLEHVVQMVEDLSFRHVRARVAKVLLQTYRPRDGLGARTGHRTLTQQEIADLVGTAREVVSRSLAALEIAGLIRIGRNQIDLLNPEALEALVESD